MACSSTSKPPPPLIRTAVDPLTAEATDVEIANVCASIKSMLLVSNYVARFIDNVYELLEKGFESDEALQPVIAELIFQLRNVRFN